MRYNSILSLGPDATSSPTVALVKYLTMNESCLNLTYENRFLYLRKSETLGLLFRAARMANSKKKLTVVPALEKALDIMEYIAETRRPVLLKEISVELGIPPATVYRTVNYLCHRHYLRKDSQIDGAYLLGPQLLSLSRAITEQTDLLIEAGPVLNELAANSEQTAQIGILQDFGVMYIDQRLPAKPVNIIAALRVVIPVNLSASGKILVAYLPPREQEYFLERAQLVRQTENSIVNKAEFQQELLKVKETGYALDHEEYARGIGCVAAPIWDHTGRAIAAIGLTGRVADYAEENLERLICLVKDAANEISRRFGATDRSGESLSELRS